MVAAPWPCFNAAGTPSPFSHPVCEMTWFVPPPQYILPFYVNEKSIILEVCIPCQKFMNDRNIPVRKAFMI